MLEAVDIYKSYTMATNVLKVLKGVSLKVQKGEMISIVGPSGAGKSTLLHILGGLDKPEIGKVSLEDDDLYKVDENERAKIRNRKIGFIFQFYHLLPEFTALENVMLPALISEDRKQTDKFEKRATELLDRVGLKGRLEHKPSELSGGEQQRVAIARALMNEPKIILCDEPTGNLDSETGRGIISLLKDLNTHNRQTLVIVTHDESISKLSHRTIPMRDGQLA